MRTIASLVFVSALALAPPLALAGPDDDKDMEKGAGYLGIHLQRIDGGLAEALDLDEDFGVLVRQVEDDSPAATAGLEAGDIITKIDGEKTGDPHALRRAIRSHDAGDQVKIDYLRDGKSRNLTVTLASVDDDDRGRDSPRFVRRMHDRFGDGGRGVRDLRFHGDHGFLGVNTQPLTGNLGDYFGVEDNRGALVSEVVKDSPAEKLGLKAGDVILSVGDKEIDDPGELGRAVRSYEEPETVEITWIRDGKKKSGQAELEVREGMQWFDESSLGNLDLGHFWGGPGLERHVEIRRFDEDSADALEELREELEDLRQSVKELQEKVQ